MIMATGDYDSMMGRTGGSPAGDSASSGGGKTGKGGKAWLLVLAFLAVGGTLAYLVMTTEKQKDENTDFRNLLASNDDMLNTKIDTTAKRIDEGEKKAEAFKMENAKKFSIINESINGLREQSGSDLLEVRNVLEAQGKQIDELLSVVVEQKKQLDAATQQIADLKIELGDKATKADLQGFSSALEARIAKESKRISNIEYSRRKEKVAIEDRIKQIDSELLARAAKTAEEEKKPDGPANEWKTGIPANQGN